MKIAITGHRPNKLGFDYSLSSKWVGRIAERIVDVLEEQRKLLLLKNSEIVPEITGICGMALGIDTLYARICVQLGIPFIAALPFVGQERIWPNASKALYYSLLRYALAIHIVDVGRTVSYSSYEHMSPTGYSGEKMHKRNVWMVDQLNIEQNDALIGVWDKSSGGTANCIKYAQNKIGDGNIIYINPKDYK